MITVKLDMEMPVECHECKCQLKFKDGEDDDWYTRRCILTGKVIEYPRPKWCPLKSDCRGIELLKAAKEMIAGVGSCFGFEEMGTVKYDDADCDGQCLVEDIESYIEYGE